jgi:hypothetical protein
MSSNSDNRFTLVVVYADGDADVARSNDEGKVRRVMDEIIEQPQGVVSVTCMEGRELVAAMTFERMPQHLLQ